MGLVRRSVLRQVDFSIFLKLAEHFGQGLTSNPRCNLKQDLIAIRAGQSVRLLTRGASTSVII